MAHAGGRPPIFKTAKELEDKIQAYYIDCDERQMPYTIEGLAYTCGCDRRTITNYAKEEEFFPIIKKHREKILTQLAELAISGKGNPTSIIFNLKNNYGYTDKTETELSGSLTIKSFEDFYGNS